MPVFLPIAGVSANLFLLTPASLLSHLPGHTP